MQQITQSGTGRALLRATWILGLAGTLQAHAATNSSHGATISGSPPTTATVGQAYSFTPAYTVPSGSTPFFRIAGKPSWATFNHHTGRLAGTPEQAGTTGNIRISLSTRRAFAWLPAFSIQVQAAGSGGGGSNTPPTISGQPPTSINEGSTYSFTPAAKDANGDKLTFSISGKPAWASFNTASGMLSGTPTAPNVGTYPGIVISVSDGKSGASLPAFSVAVDQVSNGSAQLSWAPPTSNSDGSTLTNLAGYHLHYGTQKDSLGQSVTIANPGVAAYTITNLSSGTWYFGLTAYTAGGQESAMSNVGSKTIN
ncbi:MAG: putative Ig domain-containing protein [Steroidobacteraceae bacterium]